MLRCCLPELALPPERMVRQTLPNQVRQRWRNKSMRIAKTTWFPLEIDNPPTLNAAVADS